MSLGAKSPTTATTVNAYFSQRADASGRGGPIEFYIWTTLDGQDDLQLVYGEPVPGFPNKWKAVIRRDAHGNQTGQYNIHVWTKDALGNYDFATASTLQMN